MKWLKIGLLAVLLTGCSKPATSSSDAALTSNTPDPIANTAHPEAICASAEAQNGIAQILYERIWGRIAGSGKLPFLSDQEAVRSAMVFDRPAADEADQASGSVKCSIDIALPSATFRQTGAFAPQLHVLDTGKMLVTRAHFSVQRQADNGKMVVDLELPDELAEFVLKATIASKVQVPDDGEQSAPNVGKTGSDGSGPSEPSLSSDNSNNKSDTKSA